MTNYNSSETTNDLSSYQTELLSEDDQGFINANGMRAYAEKLQDKIVHEIRDEILKRMGLDKDCLPALSELEKQTIEGLVSIEIDTRIQTVIEMDNEASNANNIQLKALMLSQGRYEYFEDKQASLFQKAS